MLSCKDVQSVSKPHSREDLVRESDRALASPDPGVGASTTAAEKPDGTGWPLGSVALVVEDDPLIRMNLAQMVELMDLQPQEADRAEPALAWLRGNPAPAMMITDFTLPGMDGLALAVEARKICPALPVMLVTGHSKASLNVPPELRDSMIFLGKPFSMLDLEEALRALGRAGAAGAAG